MGSGLQTFQSQIAAAAGAHGLDPRLVTALVQVESTGQPWAWNPEPRYRYFWNVRTQRAFRPLTPKEVITEDPPADFPTLAGDRDQEWWGQQASWGLMQVMGAVAREYGMRGPFLTQLCDPATNLEFGCAHLARLLRWANGNRNAALAAYNGGTVGNAQPPYRNQQYLSSVLTELARTEKVTT